VLVATTYLTWELCSGCLRVAWLFSGVNAILLASFINNTIAVMSYDERAVVQKEYFGTRARSLHVQ